MRSAVTHDPLDVTFLSPQHWPAFWPETAWVLPGRVLMEQGRDWGEQKKAREGNLRFARRM